MNIKDYLMEQPFLFELWQKPFAHQKFAHLEKHADISSARFVLDVGCGPGTNAPRFGHAQYLGVDINEKYVEQARQRHHGQFLVADVTDAAALPTAAYDFILVNSFLHHLDAAATSRILERLAQLLTPEGHLHSVELVLPEKGAVARWLALQDRGKFPRTLATWRELFEERLQTVIFEPFTIRHFGYDFLELVYFKGRRKS